MLIFHGRVNTCGSSIVASYWMASWPIGSVSLDDMQGIAMKVPGPVEPRRIGEICDVDDQRVAFPVAD